jgi:gliding motility-associated-like protein
MNYFKTFISGLALLLFSTAHSQSVDFNFASGNGLFCNPQAITFTQNCTGNPVGFIWRFGNGQSGSSPTQTVTYISPGTYNVSLTAIYSANAISVTKTVVINPTPTISITPDKNYMCQLGNVTFTAPGSAFISSYEWNFGDGTPVQITFTNTVTHFFNSYNNFQIDVKGTSGAGCFASASTSVQVSKFLIIYDSITPNKGCIPVNAILTASANFPNGDVVANYAWDFGDGTPIVNTAVNNTPHTYNIVTPITTAGVTMTSAQGCTNQSTFLPFAFGTPPFNTNAVTSDGRNIYCGSERVEFTGFAVNANSYSWDFGDGNTGVTSSTTIGHKYNSLGNKRVILTPVFNGCEGTKDTVDITIIGVVADYTFANQCSSKNTYLFNNLSSGNVSVFRWTFSDIPGSPDFINYNVTHTFPTTGSFTTKLYLFDAITGCSDSLTTDQFTTTPVLTSNKSNVCKDSLIQYTVMNPYPAASNYKYEFHVPGLSVSTGTISSYAFSPVIHGVFNDFVVINGPGNNTCNDTLYLPASTNVRGPVLDFSVPITSCLLNNSFPLTNNTFPFFPAETIKKWDWVFGDNTTDNRQFPPAHSYTSTGNYFILLKATDINNCAQKDSVLVSVYPMPDINVFPQIDTICSGQSLILLAFTADTLLWRTNYNLTCVTVACDTVLINPLVTTSYIAQAKNRYGCINTDTSFIRVYAPFTLQVFPADTSVCPKALVPYKANVSGIVTWVPPTYLSSATITNPKCKPDTSISYTIIVADSAGCYADTTTANIQTYRLPTVNAGSDQIVPYNNSFTLNPAYSPGITNYLWSPSVNSLTCTSCPVANGIAAVTAKYTIEVTSSDGCKVKDDIVVIIACDKANLNMPTGFTPNNDGRNDMFYPMTRGYKTINKFIIFDRWGNTVFERYNFTPNLPSLGWNGNAKDKQTSGSYVFVWIIEATCDIGEKVVTKGTVVLIR